MHNPYRSVPHLYSTIHASTHSQRWEPKHIPTCCRPVRVYPNSHNEGMVVCIQVLVPLHLYTHYVHRYSTSAPIHTHIDCCMLQSPSVHTNAHYYYFLCALYSTNFYVALQISSTNVPFVGNICAIESKISR